jgi:type I restriction enzyme S subunit
MNEEWRTSKLHTVADVRVSNVDKKFYATETPVRLCNYMDVYTNDYVTAAIDFMTASASKAQIERFRLMAGDVVITKDSETPDDIGVSAVIAEQISGLVCGYHLALIRPRDEAIDPVYLAKQLRSSRSIKYFAANASGSTRFGLSISAIENLEIPLAPRPEQTMIGEILATVDRAIEQTEALIAKQQRIKVGLLQDLLTRGIDEHGNLRSEQTHQFKDSPLGRIPAEWIVATLGNVIGPIVSGWSPTCDSEPASEGEWCVLKTTAVVWAGYDERETKRLPAGLNGIESITVQPDDILITRKGPVDRVGVVVHVHKTRSRLMIPDTVFRTRLVGGSGILPEFLPYTLGSAAVQSDWFQKKIGLADAQVNLNHSILRSTVFPKPTLGEQRQIVVLVATSSKQLHAELRGLLKLRSLKTALMQDLLTGKRRVTSLLSESSEASA